MPNICPRCGNPDHVYEHGNDPVYGRYVLCSLHGIQVCGEVRVYGKTPDLRSHGATPILEYLDGGMK
jgi:hypothetical protein